MTIVALEAAISGTPVLLTKQCDFDELQDAGGGLAVDASVESLEYGLRKLLSNPGELKQMGINGKEFVLKNYHWDHVCKHFIEIFKK
jgi:glycosyltransferase involved in cell wall biosynthesis